MQPVLVSTDGRGLEEVNLALGSHHKTITPNPAIRTSHTAKLAHPLCFSPAFFCNFLTQTSGPSRLAIRVAITQTPITTGLHSGDSNMYSPRPMYESNAAIHRERMEIAHGFAIVRCASVAMMQVVI